MLGRIALVVSAIFLCGCERQAKNFDKTTVSRKDSDYDVLTNQSMKNQLMKIEFIKNNKTLFFRDEEQRLRDEESIAEHKLLFKSGQIVNTLVNGKVERVIVIRSVSYKLWENKSRPMYIIKFGREFVEKYEDELQKI